MQTCDHGCCHLLTCCRCEEVGFPLHQLQWQQGVAEELPLQENSQDIVISTLVRERGGGLAEGGRCCDVPWGGGWHCPPGESLCASASYAQPPCRVIHSPLYSRVGLTQLLEEGTGEKGGHGRGERGPEHGQRRKGQGRWWRRVPPCSPLCVWGGGALARTAACVVLRVQGQDGFVSIRGSASVDVWGSAVSPPMSKLSACPLILTNPSCFAHLAA